ncbi:hypothetical protein EXN66_Car003501 [Channa argus]|uniref:Uncharacterized protein n=1 Tax=Channa argus TaxID=215402 RepID=A0A6G1PC94_CHAAH|nr:hypothetical protein EXN66_Car003501 [Channa argus]
MGQKSGVSLPKLTGKLCVVSLPACCGVCGESHYDCIALSQRKTYREKLS